MWQYVVFQEKIKDLPEVRKLEMWNVPSDVTLLFLQFNITEWSAVVQQSKNH